MLDGKPGNAAEAVATLRQLIAGSGPTFVIYDLEVTSWEGTLARRWGGPGEFPEIVQIGAVKLAGGAGQAELDFFTRMIRPVRNPILSDYIINLTGITQADVDTMGVSFPDALQAFARFTAGCRALSNGGDDEYVAVNLQLHQLMSPFGSGDLVNISPHLRQAMHRTEHVLSSDIPALVGAATAGRAHEALADARAVAMAVRHLLSGPV